MEMVISAATNMAVSFALSYLFAPNAPDQFGPRLSDLRSQVPSTGNTINKVFGNPRIAGRVIYASAKRETAHTTSQGGKGGGGGGSQTTYSYSMDFAISLGAVQSMGIGKIWFNKKLVYNSRSTDFATAHASVLFAQGFKLYPGSETQLPDPTIEAALGVGNVPAYRGQSYLVFSNLQLEKYFNNIPTVEVELITSGSYTPTISILNGINGTAGGHHLFSPSGVGSVAAGPYTSLTTGFIYDANQIFSIPVSGASPRLIGTVNAPYPTGRPYVNNHIFYRGTDSYVYLRRFNISNPTNPVAMGNMYTGVGTPFLVTGRFNFIFAVCGSSLITFELIGITDYRIHSNLSLTHYCGSGDTIIVTDQYLVMSAQGDHYVTLCGGVAAGVPGVLAMIYFWRPYAVACDDAYLYIGGQNGLAIYDISDHFNPVLVGTLNPAPQFVIGGITLDGNLAYVSVTDGMSSLAVIDITNKAAPTLKISSFTNIATGAPVISGGYIFSGYSDALFTSTYSEPLTSVAATLSSIVTNICASVGVTNIDVSQLTDLVDGFVIGAQMSARAALEQLQKAFYFDAVDSDGTIKFIKRGGVTYTAIAEDDLVIDGGKPPSAALSRVQEVDLPKVVNVMFYNSNNAYQQGAQHAIKQITTSKQILDLTLPIYISDSKAKQVADVNLYMAWAHRNAVNFSTSRKYAYLDPTDPIQIAKANGTTYTLLPTRRTERPGGVVDWECLADDPNIYSQTAIAGALLTAPVETVPSIVSTIYELLDIPIVRDTDDYSGMYTAATGGAGWAGGGLYKSLDGGATFTQQQSLPVPGAVIGSTASTLGGFSGGFVFDESSTVIILLPSGTLSSVTRTQILNGANVAVVGNEIIQFRDAALVATNTYQLTGMLRGLFGTDQHIPTHTGYERFVLLDTATIQRLIMQIAETGLDRVYKGVSSGQLFSDVNPITFACANNGLKPLSAVAIGGGRNAAGDITINWKRRSRVGGAWMNFVDVQVGETVESYSIDIMNGAAVVRTLTSATPTVSYTAAQQNTDFGGLQSSVTAKIYQISSTIGRGFPGTGVI